MLLKIEYDGTGYCGWQVQNNGVSIQQKIEEAILKITGEQTRIHGSGRTDAGVHALAQTATFRTNSTIPPQAMCKALNSALPQDISIISSEEVRDEFHARYSARGKRYEYLILNRECRSPFYMDRAYFYRKDIDLGKMKKAAGSFQGTHDFTGFMSSGSSVEDRVRTIYESKVIKEGALIRISIYGNGFLYNMVRIICGTLLYAGIGKIDPADMEEIINSRNRKSAGPTLPACGLYLKEVIY